MPSPRERAERVERERAERERAERERAEDEWGGNEKLEDPSSQLAVDQSR